jgi:hypothetical protein
MPGSISLSISGKALLISICIQKIDVVQAIPAFLEPLSFKIALAKSNASSDF